MKTAIFFIAILPNREICSEIKTFKEYTLAHFDSGHALRSPAHITLEPPFKWDMDQLSMLESALKAFAEKASPFTIELNDFDVFSPKVVFVKVLKNKALWDFQYELTSFLRSDLNLLSDRPDRPFHPHMTIAFKDLRKEMFLKARDHFSKITYQRNIKADQICLLQHNGKVWKEKAFFKMNE